MPADAVDKASDSPIILWVIIVILAIVIVLSGAKQIGGKWGELVTQWTTSRRRAADDAKAAARKDKDAERDEMNRQIKTLTRRVDQLTTQMEQQTEALIAHQAWDHRVLGGTDAGAQFGPPPPLWPASIPITQPPVSPGVSSSPEATA